jgi:hypothetical protein
MTTAIGAWISLPGSPVASTMGMSASAAVSAVIRMGMSRSTLPRTTASSIVTASVARRWR